MDLNNSQGAPLFSAILVLVAIVILGGISFAFQGSIQF